MINLEHKLTVDDLIVEYMIYKVKNGYEPSFLVSEFMDFLLYFESKMDVFDCLYDGNKLFKRFFERKILNDWCCNVGYKGLCKEDSPHMDVVYSSIHNDYLIKANYKLSDFDLSCINTYFMDNGMGKFNKGKVVEIRNIIKEYLSDKDKRKLDDGIEVFDNELVIAKYVSSLIIVSIWNTYIEKYIKNRQWPTQCRNINKYLFDMDLAEIIGIKSIKNRLLEIYSVFSKRIAILYHNDNNLKISSSYKDYLSRNNYELLIKGYEDIMNDVYRINNKSLDIDLNNLIFNESHTIDRNYDWDEDLEIKTNITSIGNECVRKLVRKLDCVND